MSKTKKVFFLLLFLTLIFPKFMLGQAGSSQGDDAEKVRISEKYDQWKGLGFGMAIGLAIPFQRIVDGYEISAERILRVTQERTSIGQILLESHYFFPLRRPTESKYTEKIKSLSRQYIEKMSEDNSAEKDRYFKAIKELEDIRSLRSIGIGPFVAILPGTDKLLKAIGFGVMVGFRRGKTSNSFNIGAGYISYSDVKVLADYVQKDAEIPWDVSDPIKISNTGGFLLLFSFSF